MSDVKPRDVQVALIGTDTTAIAHWERLKFEVEYSCNGVHCQFLSNSGRQNGSLDPPGESFTEIYLQGSTLIYSMDYVILGHSEPDCNTESTLELAPQVTFICSKPGSPADCLPEQELKISVTRGKKPWTWAEDINCNSSPFPPHVGQTSFYTYDPETRILFTDKLFGTHVCGEQVFDEGWKLQTKTDGTTDSHAAPRQVEIALNKCPLSVKLYAPGHGPIVRATAAADSATTIGNGVSSSRTRT